MDGAMSVIINGTTGISGVDGSASTPAVQGTDTNTGVFFGTDTVTIQAHPWHPCLMFSIIIFRI